MFSLCSIVRLQVLCFLFIAPNCSENRDSIPFHCQTIQEIVVLVCHSRHILLRLRASRSRFHSSPHSRPCLCNFQVLREWSLRLCCTEATGACRGGGASVSLGDVDCGCTSANALMLEVVEKGGFQQSAVCRICGIGDHRWSKDVPCWQLQCASGMAIYHR
jgi:hypothetical protein